MPAWEANLEDLPSAPQPLRDDDLLRVEIDGLPYRATLDDLRTFLESN